MRIAAAILAVSLALSGCAQQGGAGGSTTAAPGSFGMNKTTGGGLLGAVGGGLAGAQLGHGTGKIAAAAAGTLLGAFVGSQVGQSLDKSDELYAQRAGQQAFETGQSGRSVAWNNPDSGAYGSITPTRTYQPAPNQYCREYQQTIVVAGQQQQSFGTACRQPDGSWKVVSQ